MAIALLHMLLTDRDGALALLFGDGFGLCGEVLHHLIEGDFFHVSPRVVIAFRLIGVGPAYAHVAFRQSSGVEPVGDTGVAVAEHMANHVVGVAVRLYAVDAALSVGEVEGFAPQVTEAEADVVA